MNRRVEGKGNVFPGLFIVAGFLLLVGGVDQIYRPAAFIVAGLLLGVFGFFGRQRTF